MFQKCHPLLLIFFIAACNIDKNREIDINKIDFKTTEASEIFFKNVRQSDYDKLTMKEAGMEVFRMKDRSDGADYPLIHLAIAYNWRNDRAHLMLEPNSHLPSVEDIDIVLVDGQSGDERTLHYTQGNLQTQAVFASEVYKALQKGQQIYLLTEDKKLPFLDRHEDREVFRKTVFDFYKLVNVVY